MTSAYLNLGCGERFHADWVNLDLHPSNPSVQKWDLQANLPFPEESFDVVYHSHVLEHFSKCDGLRLLERCRRVLRRGGTIRVVVPDLERIVQLYLSSLEKCVAGNQEAAEPYDWAMLEMYDQTVREGSGGEMLAYIHNANESQLAFAKERLGAELERMRPGKGADANGGREGKKRGPGLAETLRRKAFRLIAGREGISAYDQGMFRRSGELHKWMYDRYSLGKALKTAGFTDTKQCGASESRIAEWTSFHLDTEPDGSAYKPDSLFMEAIRP
jgi:predicted SAM-dependent methyltransferase